MRIVPKVQLLQTAPPAVVRQFWKRGGSGGRRKDILAFLFKYILSIYIRNPLYHMKILVMIELKRTKIVDDIHFEKFPRRR